MYSKYLQWRNWERVSYRRTLAEDLVSKAPLQIPKKTGLLETNISDLGGDEEVLEEAVGYLDVENIGDFRVGDRRMTTGYIEKDDLNSHSSILEFLLSRNLISTVASYLGVIPIITNIDLLVGAKRDDTEGLNESELFHCDWADIKQVKLFIHCNNIDEDMGPLTAVPANKSKKARDELNYTYGGSKYRVKDETMEKYVAPSSYHVATGQKGDVCMVDSSRCFHYGSRSSAPEPRVEILVQYLTPTGFLLSPKGYHHNAPYQHLASPEMGELERMVLGTV